jgi:hypothetical protein
MTDPQPNFQRRWAIGFVSATLVFVGLTAIGLVTQSFGYAFVVGAPFIAGMIIGRWVEVVRVVQVLCAVIVLGGVIFGAVTTSLAGAICGTVFGFLAAIPFVAGVVLGAILSRPRRPSGAIASVFLVAVLIPVEHHALPAQPIISVSTSRVFAMSQARAFNRITFYEDTHGDPPRLLRIALPRPIATIGQADHVGDRPRCLYDKGYIIKEITAINRPSFYAFRVVKQVGVESHAVRLISGSFRLARIASHATRVTLTTRYRPKLTARFAWGPFERAVIRALHEHVLQHMAETR